MAKAKTQSTNGVAKAKAVASLAVKPPQPVKALPVTLLSGFLVSEVVGITVGTDTENNNL